MPRRYETTRRRIRPGYLACRDCDRDLPEAEFRPEKRVRKDGTVRWYPCSYCRACSRKAWREKEQAKRRADPAYAERRRAGNRRSYRKRVSPALAGERAWRRKVTVAWVAKLERAGVTKRSIAAAAGVSVDAVQKWAKGACSPRAEAFERLRLLAAGERRSA